MARTTGASARVLRTDSTPEEQESAILAAAIHEFADVGIRRANMDLVARRAGISRSTLYRRFPNKDELLTAALRETSNGIGQLILESVRGLDPTQAIIEAVKLAFREVDASPLLQRILISDTEFIGTVFGFTGPDMDTVLDAMCDSVAITLRVAGATMPDEDLRTAAELLVRLSTSLIQSRSRAIDLSSDDAIAAFADKFLVKLVW